MRHSQQFNIIDCHNHSLPSIDDGSLDMEMSLAMLRVAEASGTTDVFLTPHHLNGAFTNFADSIVAHIDSLRHAAESAGITVRLHPGCEVHLVSETAEQLIKHKALTYAGLGKAALIELPKNSIPTGVESILSELIFNGITPVIAHPERNSSLRSDPSPLQDWVEFGCNAQLTGQSCTGEFGDSLQDFSFKLISRRLIHLVASDAHRPTGRSPDLRKAARILTETFGTEACELLLYRNPLCLIEGRDMSPLSMDIKTAHTEVNKRLPRKNKTNKPSILKRLLSYR